MSGVSFRVSQQEMRQLQRELTVYTQAQKAKAVRNMNKARLIAETVAKKESEPIDTGTLRGEVSSYPTNGGLGGRNTSHTEYASYINNGTSRIPGRYYMEKGSAAGARKFIELMK